MKSIEYIDSILLQGEKLRPPENPIDLEAGFVRVPLLFLVDISGSMEPALPVINRSLAQLMNGIYNAEGAEKYIVDLAIITFGGNGVVLKRDFDLLRENETFQIEQCDGMTPLGEAMLCGFYLSAKRKQQYKEERLVRYNQPTIVLITDYMENNSRMAAYDGKSCSGSQLYNEMAELYSEAFNTTYKQYTYSITPDGLSIDTARRDKLKVDIVESSGIDIGQVLKRVISEYKASLAQATEEDILGAVAAASGDFAVPTSNEYSSKKLSYWQDKARRVNPLFTVDVVDCEVDA
ncbi:MAG: hypothetical protein LBC41_11305 [Clostridiales bacterium]|jgi:hypothetical protein|nr:hypothetical protein [Clostridiales bacterium]MDR2751238.1 hypothetical protein [Clostridiales bacterium]